MEIDIQPTGTIFNKNYYNTYYDCLYCLSDSKPLKIEYCNCKHIPKHIPNEQKDKYIREMVKKLPYKYIWE